MASTMPRKSKFKLPPLKLGNETLGKRLARLRKQKGFTQVELAEKIGIIQTIISDYERDRIRPRPDMIVRYAKALKVSTDEILGVKKSGNGSKRPNLKIARRMRKIEELSPSQQKAVLESIDAFFAAIEKTE